MAAKDDNGANVLYGVSHRDGVTPVQIQFDGMYMKVDTTTAIEFDPTVSASQTENDVPIAKATSLLDDETVLPWVVNEDTGAVLVSFSS